jgi:hypothetical protein
VQAGDHAAALAHLQRYERENSPRRRPAPPEPLQRGAWLGSAAYAAIVLLVGYLAGSNAFGFDWFVAAPSAPGWSERRDLADDHGPDAARRRRSPARKSRVRHRVRVAGGATARPRCCLGHGADCRGQREPAEFVHQPAMHSSIGASTAVFATLGLLAAYAWRRRAADGGRWAYRWAPLVAGVILLGFTGAGGERTDVLAHLTGFVMGAVAGAGHAAWRCPRGSAAQVVAGLSSLAAVCTAWAFAVG